MLSKPKLISTRLSKTLLNANQDLCITRLFETDASLIVADMGFGKTVCTLTAIQELLAEGVVSRVLILAPLKVCKTVWRQEAEKWEHTKDLKIAAAIGDADARSKAIESSAEIVLMNYENIVWFFGKYKDAHGFEGLVCDEISKLKNSGGASFKKLRHRLPAFKWRAGLTGTPVSEDFMGLYGQIFILDSGKRLGTRKDIFLHEYFYPTDYMEYNWELSDPTGVVLMNQIEDLIFIADNKQYQESLMPMSHFTVPVTLPKDARKYYEDLKKDCMVDAGGGLVTADNAAVLVGKLTQVASGFLYGDEDAGTLTEHVHDAKILECVKLVNKLSGPVVIAYWFKEDLKRLQVQFPQGVALSGSDDLETIRLWNLGRIDVMFLQPRSAGHGLQLQFGGHSLIWFGPVWSRDLTEQTEARLHRQGQKNCVQVYTLCSVDTVDELIVERVVSKASYKSLLTSHLG